MNEHHLLTEALHLAYGASMVGQLRRLGAKRVLGLFDSFSTGPVALDSARCTRRRSTYWRAFYALLRQKPPRYTFPGEVRSAADLRRALRRRREGQPVVLWSFTAEWGERLFEWWACHALRESGVSPREIWLRNSSASEATRCSALFLRTSSRCWAAYATGDLGALQRHGGEALPPAVAALVPELRGRRLHLSAADSSLLALFADSWNRIASWSSVMQDFGDLFPVVRMRQWASFAPQLVEQRTTRQTTPVLDTNEYRLTSAGRSQLSEGLTEPTLAPPVAMGGFVAYTPTMKWACERSAGAWRFVRLPAQRG